MKTIQKHIARKQQEFNSHVFFQRLTNSECLDEHILVFAKTLTFWVLAFQDILRLNESLVTDQALKRMVSHHLAEDAGHDKWFMSDLLAIEGSIPDLAWIFGKDHEVTRTASYALVSEVYRARTDYERMALLLSIESTGHVFFQNIVAYFERVQFVKPLQYFSRKHLNAEKQHKLFEERLNATLLQITLTTPIREACRQLVDRVYAAFDTIFMAIESLRIGMGTAMPHA